MSGLHTWDFSWDRADRLFRFRADGEEVRAQAIEGYAYIAGADAHTGHMQMQCRIDLTAGGQANLWLEDGDIEGSPAVPDGAEFADAWQLCFFRREEKWRIWDKRDRANTLRIVDGYQGPAYITWPAADRGGHIFAYGRKWEEDGIVHFAGDRR